MLTVNERLHDLAICHQIGLLRFGSATVRKILALLNRTDADLVGQIQARLGDVSSITDERLNALLAAIRDINRKTYEMVGNALHGELIAIAGYEIEFQIKAFTDALPIVWELAAPSPATLAAAVNSRPFQGGLLREWV